MKKYLYILFLLFFCFVGCEDDYKSVPIYEPIFESNAYEIFEFNKTYPPVYVVESKGTGYEIFEFNKTYPPVYEIKKK